MKKKILDEVLTDDPEINDFIKQEDFGNAVKSLLKQQQNEWPALAAGYDALDDVQIKEFQFDGFKIKVQFNRGRIISSSAKVDKKSIEERPCFLCTVNLPEEQEGILYRGKYLVLSNPYPIFPGHFTISHIEHKPQQIENYFDGLLFLAKDLSKYYSVFYNGPECGASAPDHLHFQAGSKNFLPVENEFHLIKNEYGKILFEDDNLILSSVNDGIRKFISLESDKIEKLLNAFEKIYKMLLEISGIKKEPLMNILVNYEKNHGWRVIIFLREKHRPEIYYKEGEENILISPAVVDLSGIIITPREKDYKRLSKNLISEVVREVTLSDEKFSFISGKLELNF